MNNTAADVKSLLYNFSGMSDSAFALSENLWTLKAYGKGEKYNSRGQVCKTAGFIIDGYFRGYKTDNTGEERNAFIFPPNQILVAYKSFVEQLPCNYDTEAVTDATIIGICYNDLQQLYHVSPEWERFGRLMAEYAFKLVEERFFGYYFLSPEDRYRKLLKDMPDILNAIALHHISSYLGIEAPSLSRIRKRISR